MLSALGGSRLREAVRETANDACSIADPPRPPISAWAVDRVLDALCLVVRKAVESGETVIVPGGIQARGAMMPARRTRIAGRTVRIQPFVRVYVCPTKAMKEWARRLRSQRSEAKGQ